MPPGKDQICVLMNGSLDPLQVGLFDIVFLCQDKTLSIPGEFCVTAMSSHVDMNRFVFVREEQENKTILSE